MSATFEQLEQRVAYLERELRRTTAIIDQLDARTDIRLAAIDQHLASQDTTQQEFAVQVNQRFEKQDAVQQEFAEQVNQRFEQQAATQHAFALGVNQRFEHVYGALADINANTVEMRNILASLVEKQK